MLNTGHAYRSMANTMKVLKTEKKGKHLNTLEKYHIYKMSKGLQMNDTYIDIHNPIFEVIQEINNSDKNTLQKEGPVQLSEAFKKGHTTGSAAEGKEQ
jgi:hypothetical protein